jgi:hypothetical protein
MTCLLSGEEKISTPGPPLGLRERRNDFTALDSGGKRTGSALPISLTLRQAAPNPNGVFIIQPKVAASAGYLGTPIIKTAQP